MNTLINRFDLKGKIADPTRHSREARHSRAGGNPYENKSEFSNQLGISSVKKIWFAPYELKNKTLVRHGILLKVEFVDGKTGHADLHPYPEKGEASLKTHLEKLRKKEFTNLCLRSVAIAREEAQAQAKGINMLSCLKIPLSHYLILDIENFYEVDAVLSQGFKVFKVKLNHPLKKQTHKLLDLMQALGSSVKWRLDFHINLNERQWNEWTKECLVNIDPNYLDFIEAPFDYQESWWLENKKHPLALDVWGGENTLPVSTLVWKSSRKNPQDLFRRWNFFKRVVFTHSLSHPLDQLSSAYFAACFYQVQPRLTEVCGLVQKGVYEKQVFTLPDQGPFFPRLSDAGWGFSFLLDHLPWKKLLS